MRSIVAVLACVLLLPAVSSADKGGKGKGQGKAGRGHEADSRGGGVSVTVVFAPRERELAQQYFVERHGRGACPPGLAKKNNGCLPPGQAKKRYAVGRPLPAGIRYEPLPRELALRLGAPPRGYSYGMLDGDLVKLAAGTMMVVDAIEGLVN